MGKIDALEEYIRKANRIIISSDAVGARKLIDTIVNVYRSEIPYIYSGLYSYESYSENPTTPDEYLEDMELLKGKLINYKDNLESEMLIAAKTVSNKAGSINVIQHANQSTGVTVTFTFDQAINAISELKDDVLSETDKEILQAKLLQLNQLVKGGKDQDTKWKKVTDILKWLGDKTVAVGIAALPYIVTVLQNTPA